ncbi:MAG TPA: DNA primase [Candidatus Gastranaerophilales bacterium]|nr:DNA primase [Candidatus Gastranaerophilales bacterium]
MTQDILKNNSSSRAVEEIKNHLDIVDTVSEHVVLKKTGKNFWGLCPFHKEKSPSFSVNPEKGIFKCFGCGAGGDSISFLMKINSSSFWETIVALAQKFGIELPQSGVSSQTTEIKTDIVKLNKEAADFYKKLLLDSPDAALAREYLSKRNINNEIIEKFNLGFALNSFDSLIKHLLNKKYSNELLFQAGLTSEKTNGNGYVDRFRNRIMIPIQNEKGDFIAFGARSLSDAQQPKYLNSPESLVFSKSRSLYGIYQAKEEIKKQDSIILMEGYFDVISAHVNGITNAVATLGTALTEQHIKIIAKYSDSRKIYLAFDSDEAGIAATNRGAEIIKSAFLGLGEIKRFDESFSDSAKSEDRTICEIRVITTNSGKDPDEFLRTEGVESYKKSIENAPLLIDYQINRLIGMKNALNSPQDKANLSKEIIPLLTEINNLIIRNEYIKLVAEKLGISQEAFNTEVKKSLQKVASGQRKKEGLSSSLNKENKDILAQKNLLSLYFLNTEKITPLCINNYLKEVNFTDNNFKLLKEKISEIINEINDPDRLFQELLKNFTENEAIKKILADLIYCVNDKKELSFDSIEKYIIDHINYLKTFEITEIRNKLRDEYYENNNNDETSIRNQQKVKELIEKRKTGLNILNDKIN